MTWVRTATTEYSFVTTERHIASLMHGVNPRGADWRSVCGVGFLTHETSWHPTLVTCLWCITGRKFVGR